MKKRVAELQIRDVAVTPDEAQCIEEAVAAYCQPTTTADRQCGACSNGKHGDCSGWCFCPVGAARGGCDRDPSPTPR